MVITVKKKYFIPFYLKKNIFFVLIYNNQYMNLILDPESLPTLDSLQDALLGVSEDCEEELMSVISQLVVCGVEDPGSFYTLPQKFSFKTFLKENLN